KEEKEAMNQKEFNELVHEYRKRRHVERGGTLRLTIDISNLIEEVKKQVQFLSFRKSPFLVGIKLKLWENRMMKNLKQIIAVYRIERQKNEKLQSKKAAKKTLQLIQAISGIAIPYGGF